MDEHVDGRGSGRTGRVGEDRRLVAGHLDARLLRMRLQRQGVELRDQLVALGERQPDHDRAGGADTLIGDHPDPLEAVDVHGAQGL